VSFRSLKSARGSMTSVLNLKFGGLRIDSMIADSSGFGEDGHGSTLYPRWGSMRWNALS
jgi:hypothetical protein